MQEILIGFGATTILLAGLALRTEIRLRKLLRGNKAKNLEESIALIEKDLKEMTLFKKGVTTYLEAMEKRVGKSIQGVGTVRFNPFKGDGSGGNQSFATSLINEKGDGVILSSMYSRDHVSIFAKPIKNSNSEFELTAEEKESLKMAQESVRSGK